MGKKISDRYLYALKEMDGWVLVSEWAKKVGDLNPDLLDKANEEAANQVRETTGIREIAARISSNISRGTYAAAIEIDGSERPRKVRYVTQQEHEKNVDAAAEDDVAPLRRDEIIYRDLQALSKMERYRVQEYEAIAKRLKYFNGLEFELDHAEALMNKASPGRHHPDNLQFLLKLHNGKKGDDNWRRFTLQEQLDYIRSVVDLQRKISERLGVNVDDDVLDALLDRLRAVYE